MQAWLEGPSAGAVRAAVRSVAPHLAGGVGTRNSHERAFAQVGQRAGWVG